MNHADLQAANRPTGDLDELVHQTRWMTALARSLTGDEHAADDVVQDTWVSALRQPPAEPDQARPWLAVVMRNVVRQRGRRAARREARERAHAPRDTVVDAADLVERAEMHRRVVNAVMALTEPNRTALLKRYFDGLSVREIASAERVPHETIKARIQRGLAQLRTKLDASFGSRQAWTVAIGVLTAGSIGGSMTGAAIASGAADASTVGAVGAANASTTLALKGALVAGMVVTGTLVAWPLVREDDEPTAPKPVIAAHGDHTGGRDRHTPAEEAIASKSSNTGQPGDAVHRRTGSKSGQAAIGPEHGPVTRRGDSSEPRRGDGAGVVAASVSGTVVGPPGIRLGGMFVTAIRGKEMVEVTTGDDGKFVFGRFPAGPCRVLASTNSLVHHRRRGRFLRFTENTSASGRATPYRFEHGFTFAELRDVRVGTEPIELPARCGASVTIRVVDARHGAPRVPFERIEFAYEDFRSTIDLVDGHFTIVSDRPVQLDATLADPTGRAPGNRRDITCVLQRGHPTDSVLFGHEAPKAGNVAKAARGETTKRRLLARAPLRDTPYPKVTWALAEAFDEWANLQQPRRLKQKAKVLHKHLAKLGPDRLKAVRTWSDLFRAVEAERSSADANGIGRLVRKRWKVNNNGNNNNKTTIEYDLWVSPKKPTKKSPALVSPGRVAVMSLVDAGVGQPTAAYLDAAWVNPRMPVLAFASCAPKKFGFAWSDRSNLIYTLGVLGQQIRKDYHTDHDALFLDGYRKSGVEAWKLASSFADLFAGVIVRGAMPPEETRFEDFINTPFLLISDPHTPFTKREATRLMRRMRRKGVDVSVAHLSPGGSDEARFRAVARAVKRFLKKRRDPYPTVIDWSVKETHTRRAFWITATNEVEDETLPVGQRGRVPQFTARIDRAANGIVIVSHRVESFHINLNDALVDLDRPVLVKVNGRRVFYGKLERTWKELIDNWEIYGESTAIFPASLQVEVPPK